MAKLPPDHDSNEDAGTPRWVKIFGVIFILLIVVFVILHLTGNGFSGLHGTALMSGDLAGVIPPGIRQLT